MKDIDKTFSVYDASISIWRLSAVEDWDTHKAIRMMMVRRGFSFHQDPDIIKHYRSLANSHHHGVKRDLHFHSALTGRRIEFSFYEDVVRDNPNGGRYHFDRLKKMPYLRRKLAELEIDNIRQLLVSRGFTEQTKPTLGNLTADQMVDFHQKELVDFQGPHFYTQPRNSYNITDGDRATLRDGDVRYFWTHNGRLARGIVRYHINNMWFVVVNRDYYTAQSCGYFFAWRPEMGRKRKASPREIEGHLKRLVKAMNFESAIVLRDQLKILTAGVAA